MSEETRKGFKWKHPSEVMQMQKLKLKKKALQARIASSSCTRKPELNSTFANISSAKRKNPFLKYSDDEETHNAKRTKTAEIEVLEESSDNTLFQLLNLGQASSEPAKQRPDEKENHRNFSNILAGCEEPLEVKSSGEKWIPIDWSLKKKVRFLSSRPFAWKQNLKISEEASGVTGFTRCLDINSTGTTLDTSSNSKFHQCCLYWQQPSIPWLKLFPRSNTKAAQSTMPLTSQIKESMHLAWMSSLRSLFHLIRMRQCPFFYACANSFTVLFRAAGIAGFSEMHALISPTTRGFRHMLKQEEIEFTMPLRYERTQEEVNAPSASDDEEEQADENWLKSMGINSEDIKQINYTQAKLTQKQECEVDNSELSLVLIQGVEVQAFYSFLVHCKSAISPTGLFAGVPPTLLAPVAFHGGCLMPLEVRQNKVHVDNEDFYSIDLQGPILPHCLHNLCALQPLEHSMTATFSTLADTVFFSKVKYRCGSSDNEAAPQGAGVFNQENLSDCGLSPTILKHFCSNDCKLITHVESLKYSAETFNYSWT